VDGNTDEKEVQDKFVGTLMEMMKGENFLDYRQDDDGDRTVLHDLEGRVPDAETATVAGLSVPRQNGHIPNSNVKTDDDNSKGRHLRYDVRNMYAQMESYPNDSAL